jgi:hypothetical protein
VGLLLQASRHGAAFFVGSDPDWEAKLALILADALR